MYGPVIQGKLVRLRSPKPEDAAVMVSWFEDLETTHFLGRRNPPSVEMEKEWLESTAKDPNSVVWVVEVDGRVVGTTGIREIDWKNGFGTTGTLIGDRSLWGKGHRPRDDAAPSSVRVHSAAAAQAQVGTSMATRRVGARRRLRAIGRWVDIGRTVTWTGGGSMRS